MKKILYLLFIAWLSTNTAFADVQTNIDKGLSWLMLHQNADGSFGNQPELAFRDTQEVLQTLNLLNQKDTPYQNAFQWSVNTQVGNTDYIARKIRSLSSAGSDTTIGVNLLLSNQNLDGGWGLAQGQVSDCLDTGLALIALKTANYSDSTIMQSGINYLLSVQNTDGGWGFYQGDSSNTYTTASLLSTLQKFSQTPSIATAISRGISYLLPRQNVDGGFGTSSSTVYETALTYAALSGVITDNTVLGNAVNYLVSTQVASGSWTDDIYLTALALQALYIAQNRAIPSQPTTGTVTGTITAATTNQPLQGVSVTLVGNPQIQTMTDATGNFTLSNIPQGSQSILISFAGYTAITKVAIVGAGSVISFGSVQLSSIPAIGTINGAVTDAVTGNPIAGAGVIIAGTTFSTTTDANGAYSFSGVNLSDCSVKASAIGYNSSTLMAKMSVAGEITLNFNLNTSPSVDLKIISLSMDRQSYPTKTSIQAVATLQYTGNWGVQVFVVGEIKNNQGVTVAETHTNRFPLIDEVISLGPSSSIDVTSFGNTYQFAPGIYTIVIRVKELYSHDVLTEESLAFEILPTKKLTLIKVTPAPLFSNVGANETITLGLTYADLSNVPTQLSINYSMKDPAGTVIHSGTESLSLQPDTLVRKINLSTFSHTVTKSGDYPVAISVFSDGELLSSATGTFSVAPSLPIEPGKTLSPQAVIPDGDKRIKVNIKLQGVQK